MSKDERTEKETGPGGKEGGGERTGDTLKGGERGRIAVLKGSFYL